MIVLVLSPLQFLCAMEMKAKWKEQNHSRSIYVYQDQHKLLFSRHQLYKSIPINNCTRKIVNKYWLKLAHKMQVEKKITQKRIPAAIQFSYEGVRSTVAYHSGLGDFLRQSSQQLELMYMRVIKKCQKH
ncbi:MAG: hypothetical protein KDD40_05570 [Bdellovibrionales bacterium]|nr:hypothetical protein [Bdellovibrionales bacterium]